MQKEKWINEVLESTRGMKKAQPQAYFYERIAGRLNEQESGAIIRGYTWQLAVAAMLLVAVNVFSIKKVLHDAGQGGATTALNDNAYSAYTERVVYTY